MFAEFPNYPAPHILLKLAPGLLDQLSILAVLRQSCSRRQYCGIICLPAYGLELLYRLGSVQPRGTMDPVPPQDVAPAASWGYRPRDWEPLDHISNIRLINMFGLDKHLFQQNKSIWPTVAILSGSICVFACILTSLKSSLRLVQY